jgi:hypothetical protein
LAELLFTNVIQHGSSAAISQAFIFEGDDTIRQQGGQLQEMM